MPSKCHEITGVTLRRCSAAVSFGVMAFNALLMCREQHSLQVLRTALDELEVDQDLCAAAPEAMERMAQEHYSALVLDFDLPGAAMVVRMARLASSHRRPVVFAIIGALTEIAGTFQAGANFVLYKPLALDQVMRSLRAGRSFMQPDRRRSPRKKLETLVYLQFGVAALPAVVLDLNEHGLALQAPEPLPPVEEIPLRFVLPGTTNMIEGTGEVTWVDDTGRAGMLFAGLTPASRKQLKHWLGKRSPKKKALLRPSRTEKARRYPSVAH